MKCNRARILIVRDRESAGGGIYNYYAAISPYLDIDSTYCDVGRSHKYYSRTAFIAKFTATRLVVDWLRFVKATIQVKPKLVHINPSLDVDTFRSMWRDAMYLITARIAQKKVVVFWRGWDSSWCGKPEFPKGNKGLLSWMYRQATAHIVLSHRFKKDLLCWGIRAPIFVETTVSSDECISISNNRDSNGSRACSLLFLSRVIETKGIFEMLDAFRIVKEQVCNCSLVVAGDGPDLEELKSKRIMIGDGSIIFTGFLQGSAKAEAFSSAAIYILPSYSEGMPNSVLEAMRMGLPIVCSNTGGLMDIINEKNGKLISININKPMRGKICSVELAAAILELLLEPTRMKLMGEHNAEYALREFAPKCVAARLSALYKFLVQGTL